MTRENLISRTFLELIDTLVDDFDLIDLLTGLAHRCVELVDADACGILLVDADGNLRVIAASDEQTRLLELFQLQNQEGPCLEAFATGRQVTNVSLRESFERWPRFVPYAVGAGFESASALPLRLRRTVIGALNLFRSSDRPLIIADVELAQALADAATISVLQARAIQHAAMRGEQLQHALDSRVVIEQAKGVIAERHQVDMDVAFTRMRRHARATNRHLTDVASLIVTGELSLPKEPTRPPETP